MEKNLTIHAVDGFDPCDYVFQQRDEITGKPVTSEFTGEPKEYLLVKAQKVWFQKVYPEGAILTTYIPRDDGQHQFHARIYQHRDDALKATEVNPDAGAMATADALRLPAHGEKYAAFESAQTMAISYALENAGFGSEVALQIAAAERKEQENETEPASKNIPDDVTPDKEIVPSFELPELETQPADSIPEEATPGDDALKAFGEMIGDESLITTKATPEEPALCSEDEEEPTAAEAPAEEEKVSEAAEAEAAGTEPVEKPPAETTKAKKSSKKKTAEKDYTFVDNAGEYVITAEDIVGVPALEDIVGKTMNEIGKEEVEVMLKFVGNQITENLKNVALSFTKEE